MRLIFAGTAAAAVLIAPAAMADSSGFIQGAYSSADIEGVSDDGDGWELRGTSAWNDASGISYQVDAALGETEEIDYGSVGAHLSVRQGAFLIGAFGGYGEADLGFLGDAGYWTVGVQSQWYLERTTIDAAIVYSTDDDDVDITLTGLELGIAHFVTDGFSIGADASLGTLDTPLGDADIRTYGINAEVQVPSSPVSLFAAVSRIDIEDDDVEADLVQLGMRYNWGGTLFARDRNGALLRNAGDIALTSAF